jgi:ApaG protein
MATESQKKIVVLLFRSMLRTVRALTAHEPRLRVRQPVFESEVQWQRQPQHRILAPASSSWDAKVVSQQERIRSRFPMLTAMPFDAESGLTRAQVQQLIAAELRRSPAQPAPLSDGRLDALFQAFRELQVQQTLSRLSSSRTTAGVRVDATSGYVGRDASGGHVFQYNVSVTNVGEGSVQLVGRHWVFHNADGSIETSVPRNSPGVVGQKPVLHPRQSFEYASGATLASAQGSVHGSFQMVRIGHGKATDGFDAIVGRFECDADASVGAAPRT